MLVACLSMAMTASAQYSRSSSSDDEMSRFHMGIRGGLTVNTIGEADALAFPYGGIAMDFKVAPIPIYVESGVYYMNKGYTTDGGNASHDHSILVPVLASYHVPVLSGNKMSVQPFAGGYVSYNFDTEKEDYGVRIGCGWNYGRLYANVGYDIGVKPYEVHVSRYDTKDYFNNTLFVTIGFNWAGAK